MSRDALSRRAAVWLPLIAAQAMAGPAASTQGPAEPQETAAQTVGSASGTRASRVAGRVTEAASGAPLAGARVRMAGGDFISITNQTGGYVLMGVPPGTYDLRAEAPGYASGLRQVTVVQGTDWVIDIQLAPVREEGTRAATPRTSAPTGEIRGRATIGKELPLPYAQVYLVNAQLGTTTQQSGEYAIVNVPPGTYQLRAERFPFSPAESEVTVAAGGAVQVDFTLEPAAIPVGRFLVTGLGAPPGPVTVAQVLDSLALAMDYRSGALPAASTPLVVGRVSDRSTGLAVADVQIHLVGTPLGTVSRASGQYIIVNVPPGTYRIRAEGAGLEPVVSEITVRAGRTQVDFHMNPPP